SSIGGNAWSGSFNNTDSYAIYLQQNASIDGWAKASVTNPPDPITCGGASTANYQVRADNGSSVGGDVTTWGAFTGPGTAGGSIHNNLCTAAPAAITMPVFTYSASNYDASTLHEFGTATTSPPAAVSDFKSSLWSHNNQLAGTFYINQSS